MDDKQILSHIKRNFQKMKKIDKQGFFIYLLNALCCFCRKHSKAHRYNWWLNKSQSSITKEMDLRKFIFRQRLTTNAMLGLLSGRQSFFVDKMSQLIIRESDSQTEYTSSDNELSDWNEDNMRYVEKMAHSTSHVDKRLMNLYIVCKAD